MKFKTSNLDDPKHNALVCCVGWCNAEEVYSCGDDHLLLRWNPATKETATVAELPPEVFPTDMDWFPRPQAGGKKQGLDLLLLTAADGKFHLIGKSGRVEKSVDAHKGAVLAGRWSHDGAGFLTVGEDGQAKVWSRSGMLRSTVVQGDSPVYSAAWSPDGTQLLHTQGKALVIKALAPNSKPHRWKAHDGLILKVAWNPSNNLIISGGEDCRYKVWDTYGRQLYASPAHDHPVTALSWAPDGDLFAVGSFNTLRLCDRAGWSHSLEKPSTGSIFNIAWSSDGTQVAGACGNGHVVFAHIVERQLQWKRLEATQTAPEAVELREVGSEGREQLEFPGRVVKLALGHGRLVVVTPSQCLVHSAANWSTPAVVELRQSSVRLVLLAPRHFLLVDSAGLALYSYEGRLLASPRWAGMQPDALTGATVSLSNDTIAVRDQLDDKCVRLLELAQGARAPTELPALQHWLGVSELALSQAGPPAERQLALVDRNRDLYLRHVHGPAHRSLRKLAPMVQSLCWNSDTNVLATVQDTSLTVWFFPAVLHVDSQLVKRTVLVRDASEFGKAPAVVSFAGNHLGVRRADGALVSSAVSPYPAVLHGYASAGRWDDALRLCRFVKDATLWACLAAMAAQAKQLEAAEEAYAAIDEVDKVLYLQHIREVPVSAARLAEMCLLGGNTQEAEGVLLQNGLVFRAIMMNLRVHNWNRALELAAKHKTHVDTVLLHRRDYLRAFGKPETNERFLHFAAEVELDEENIARKVELEYEKERENG
ncbi:intraflagellar transport protein 80 homolog isoform X2 [Bacillus rossius redtenbacheri]|uniref:intraflagellar transport protein 80 homolog isoform X2 n=1 Tax=Bacillus rossius redtenbacheri TaxID=93214 RepID=UPI002FDC9592